MDQYPNPEQNRNQHSYNQAPNPDYRQQVQPHFQPYAQPPSTNGKSIAALVLGILSLVLPYIGLIIGIIGIVISSLSLKELKASGEQGRGMAIAGLVCSIIGTLLYAVIILFLIAAVILFASTESTYYY